MRRLDVLLNLVPRSLVGRKLKTKDYVVVIEQR